jgi:hypothetical protein
MGRIMFFSLAFETRVREQTTRRLLKMQRSQTTMVYLVGAEVIYQDQLNVEFDATPYGNGKWPFASGGAAGHLSLTEWV